MERAAPRLQLLKIAGLRGLTPPRPRRGRPREGGRAPAGWSPQGARTAAAPGVLRGSGAAGRGCTALLWARRIASQHPGSRERRCAGGGLAGPWGPGSRFSLGGHGLAAQRAPTPARTSARARTPALPPQSRSAASAASRWLSIPIYILGFHATFSVVLFTSVFSGGADGPLFR